jgi:hypothetical protein
MMIGWPLCCSSESPSAASFLELVPCLRRAVVGKFLRCYRLGALRVASFERHIQLAENLRILRKSPAREFQP